MEHAKAEVSALDPGENPAIFRDFRFTSLKDKLWKSIPIKRYDMPNTLSATTEKIHSGKFYLLKKLSCARSISNSESNRKKVCTIPNQSLHAQDIKSLTKNRDTTFSAMCIGESSHHISPLISQKSTYYRKKFVSLSEAYQDNTNNPFVYSCITKKSQRQVSKIDMNLEIPKSLNKVSSDRLQNTAHDLFKRINCLNDTIKHEKNKMCEIGVNTEDFAIDGRDGFVREDTYSSQLSQTFQGPEENTEACVESAKIVPAEIPEGQITYSSQPSSPRRLKTSMRNSCSNIPYRINSKASARRSVFLKHKDQVIIDESLSHTELKIQGKSPDKELRKDSREFVSIIPVRYISKFCDEVSSHTERSINSKDIPKLEPQNYKYSVEYNKFNQLNKSRRKKVPLRRLLL